MNQMRPIRAQSVSRKPPEPKVFQCGIHDLEYKAFRAGCPACEAEREMHLMRGALQKVKGELELIAAENHRLKIQVDIVYAIREAVEVLGDDDMAFLKSVLYMWRDEKSVGMKTTHGARKRGKQAPPNGFIVMPRKGDPYGHLCSSVGGLAIAEYFDEAVNSVGPAKAMEFLVKGMSAHLPGAVK
jgi:hypothetical protein